jgi:hypothetical protein
MSQENFFPSIGSVVEGASKPDDPGLVPSDAPNDDNDAPVQQIESLCMACHEQVCF